MISSVVDDNNSTPPNSSAKSDISSPSSSYLPSEQNEIIGTSPSESLASTPTLEHLEKNDEDQQERGSPNRLDLLESNGEMTTPERNNVRGLYGLDRNVKVGCLNCRFKCNEKFEETIRREINEFFWSQTGTSRDKYVNIHTEKGKSLEKSSPAKGPSKKTTKPHLQYYMCQNPNDPDCKVL